MVATSPAQAWAGKSPTSVINDRWGMRRLRADAPGHASVVVEGPLASDIAIAAHPEDLLDQVLHDTGKCGCFGH
jgi:hypothetical protein